MLVSFYRNIDSRLIDNTQVIHAVPPSNVCYVAMPKDAKKNTNSKYFHIIGKKGVACCLAWREATPRIGEDSGWIKSLGTRRDAPGVGKAPATRSEAKGAEQGGRASHERERDV